MATMVKEKRKEKKKKKEKVSIPEASEENPSLLSTENMQTSNDNNVQQSSNASDIVVSTENSLDRARSNDLSSVECVNNKEITTMYSKEMESAITNAHLQTKIPENKVESNVLNSEKKKSIDNSLEESLAKLEIKTDNLATENIVNEIAQFTSPLEQYASKETIKIEGIEEIKMSNSKEAEASPSAPIMYESPEIFQQEESSRSTGNYTLQIQSLPLQEVIRIFGEKEMMEVKAVSKIEELHVESGADCGPEHPLVDLLHTFRSSINKMNHESTEISKSLVDEEKFRSALWTVQTKVYQITRRCHCGSNIHYKTNYEEANFLKEKLGIAKMKLKSIVTQVQEAYCHYLHSALLAHCQIEDLLSYITQSNKGEIRTALSLVLQELRLSEDGGGVVCEALLRWSQALVAALLQNGDLRHLLFLVHHLFRQNRSISWAAKYIHIPVRDISEAAQAIAIIEILLTNVTVSSSKECIEDFTDQWEELDESGASGAVSDRGLRERDVIAFLECCSIGDLVSTLARIQIKDMKPQEISWSTSTYERDVLRSACGVRTLLASLHRGLRANAQHYERLAETLVDVAVTAAGCLFDLYLHSRSSFTYQMRHVIASEMETVFASTFALWITSDTKLIELPFRMLSDRIAVACSMEMQKGLHETNSSTIKSLNIEMASDVTCEIRVRIISMLSTDRREHRALANSTLEILFKLAATTRSQNCKDICVGAARACLSELLLVHPCLYSTAFVLVADLCQDNAESVLSLLKPAQWRPTPAEINFVLIRYSEMCPKLIPALLLALDYTPHSGITLETQISLAQYIASLPPTKGSEFPEWAWSVLRHINVHLAWWSVGLEAPNPASDKEGLINDMLALLTSSWGHCLPLICEYGVGCLVRLVSAGRLKEAAHCLSPIMLVLTQSPESIAFTKQFSELFNAFLNTEPTLIQRALGRPGISGSKILLSLMLQQLCHPEKRMNFPVDTMWQVWLYALWEIPAGRELIETCVCATGLTEPLLRFVQELATPTPAVSPTTPLCSFVCLLAASAAEGEAGRGGLLHALNLQAAKGQSVHVDNALKSIGSKMSSEDLVIHKTSAAILAAPLSHPSSLSLWCVFFRLYFEKSPMDPTSSIIGPLFFRGIIKSRVLKQLKTKLQETINYHQSELTKIDIESKMLQQVKTDAPKESVKPSINAPTPNLFRFQQLKLTDLIGESASQSQEEIDQTIQRPNRLETDNYEIIERTSARKRYHTLAMARSEEYLRWLDEDIANVQRRLLLRLDYLEPITEKEILAPIWQAEFERRASAVSPDDDVLTPKLTAPSVPSMPITSQSTVDRLKKYKRNNYRKQPIVLKPLNQSDVIGDTRKMKRCLEDNFQQILVCCKQWNEQSSCVVTTDTALWPLVDRLYERQPNDSVLLQCTNKCSPKYFVVAANNWCINERTKRAIELNRARSLQALTQLASPRPEMAVVMAKLQGLARQVIDLETAKHFVNEIWRYSNLSCPHLITLSDISEMLIQRFICNDSNLCAELLERWFRKDATMSSLRQSIAGALLTPKDARAWHILYRTLLGLPMPPHTAFTYLSKFGTSSLSSNLTPEDRMSTLTALLGSVERLANYQDTHQMLLELLCVHIVQLTTGDTLRFVCTRAATIKSPGVRETLSPQIQKAIEKCVTNVGFDELGHLLRDLGTTYWDIRSSLAPNLSRRGSKSTEADPKSGQSGIKSGQSYPKLGHRPSEVASQIRTIFAAFVSAAYAQQFAVERVAWYAWSALVDAWCPWVSPHEAMPLLLATSDEDNLFMLRQFLDSVRDLLNMCAGCEGYIYQQIFEWTGPIIISNAWPNVSKENAVQLSLLLNEQMELNWHEHEWFEYMANINTLLKLIPVREACVRSWAVCALRARRGAAWLRHTPDAHHAPALHQLFYVFTALPLDSETLVHATELPWYRLPATVLESCLRTFFGERFSETVPYHALPCFPLVLYASGLILHPTDESINELQSPWLRASSVEKRATCISLWSNALIAPNAQGLVTKSSAVLLNTLAALASRIEESELVDLLVRAMAMLYISPTDAAALPSWEEFLSKSSLLVTSVSLHALGALTSLEHFARLAEIAVQTIMLDPESTGWSGIVERLSSSHWREPEPFLTRSRPHLAYALSTTQPPPTSVQAHTQPFDFVKSEVILSVWICRLCRSVLERRRLQPTTATEEAEDLTITAWSQDKKNSFLRVLTMRGCSDQPTDRHRLLSRFAKLILGPESEPAKRAFEASYTAVLGPNPTEISSLTNTPSLKKLVKLAITLYPNHEKYFKYELDVSE